MADIFLTARELDQKELPKVCIACGAKAKLQKVTLTQKLTGFISFSNVTRYRLRDAWVPLCPSHENYFGRFSWIGLFIALGAFLTIGGMIVGGALFGVRHPLFFVGGFCLFVTLGFGGSFGYRLYELTKVRPTDMSRKGVELTNVCDDFADAVEDQRDDRRPRQSRRRDDDYDDDYDD